MICAVCIVLYTVCRLPTTISRPKPTATAKQRDGFAFWRTRSRGIKDGQHCGDVRTSAGTWEGCRELVTARNCLRMPLGSNTTGVSALHTVQYGSQSPADLKPPGYGLSSHSRAVDAGQPYENNNYGNAQVDDLSRLLHCIDWRQRSIVTIHTDDVILR
jgi:hypothetical protein